MNGKHYIGAKAQSANNARLYPPITKVILWADDNNYYKAGSDGGLVIEQDCPYATQDMANSLLSQLSGYQYQSIEADAAQITPTAELGDGITVNGVYTQLAYKNIRFSTGAVVDVGAPGGSEVDHEYVQKGGITQDFDHKIAQTYSQISKTAEEIKLEVANDIEDLSASIDIQIDGIQQTVQGQNGAISQIDQRVDSISATVEGQDGKFAQINLSLDSIESEIRGVNSDISSIEQYVDSITLSVSNGSTSSTISLKAGSTTISSKTISMSGLVTYTGLSSGTTTIDGGCIKTGTIDADRLNLTGAITFSDLNSSTQNTINSANNNAADAINKASSVESTLNDLTITEGYRTYIDGSRIETSELYVNSANITGTLVAGELEGSSIALVNSRGLEKGWIDISSASTADYAISIESGEALRLQSNEGVIHLSAYGSIFSDDLEDITVECNSFSPLGYAANLGDPWVGMWEEVFAYTGEINVSDQNYKYDIELLPEKYIIMLDNIEPVRYKMKNGNNGRYHTGFIAQKVKEGMDAANVSDMEFAGWCLDKDETGNEKQLLRYTEMIAPMLLKIRQLENRITELEAKV